MELKRAGVLNAKTIAERLGLSPNAVRHHLKELESAGLIGYQREHKGVGAPAFLYRLTAAGEALFPRRYEDAVSRLLDYVVAREGRAAAVEVLESRYRELAARLQPVLTDATPEERMAVVARALAAEGYMPEVRRRDCTWSSTTVRSSRWQSASRRSARPRPASWPKCWMRR